MTSGGLIDYPLDQPAVAFVVLRVAKREVAARPLVEEACNFNMVEGCFCLSSSLLSFSFIDIRM